MRLLVWNCRMGLVKKRQLLYELSFPSPQSDGLYDLDRLERMILRRVQRDFFFLHDPDTEPNDD